MKPIPLLEETSPALYGELGMISGVEIHQQLLTSRKLFCRCPAGLYNKHVHAEVLRHMRPTLSELGEYDGTALMEFKTRKEIIYQLNKESVCTYEMDDTPPFMIDEEALEIALEITMLLRCNLVSELHIARKQYLDGSIPTGFQRTTILGIDGYIRACGKQIGIIQLGLEEDSCRQVSDVGHRRIYRTDRLGMPLIEMVTEPQMVTPYETAEVVESLRRLARATGKVRTGLGATRQDVNVSIEGGTRCEIKGVPRIRMIPRLVHHEALRQRGLLELRQALLDRGHDAETFEANSADVTSMVRRTQYLPLAQALEAGGECRAVRLPGFGGILTWPLQPGISFARELSDQARVVGCLDQLPNLVHSDLPDQPITPRNWGAVLKEMDAGNDDVVILVWGPAQDVETATTEIVARARQAIIGVPPETRQAFWDGTNGFERVLPGADRMYPDTDLPPKEIPTERIEEIRSRLVEAPWERARRLRQAGVAAEQAWTIAIGPWSRDFEEATGDHQKSPAATVVACILPGLVRHGMQQPTGEQVRSLLSALENGTILLDGVPALFKEMAISGEDVDAAQVALGVWPAAVEERAGLIAASLAAVDRPSIRKGGDAAGRAVMGQVMQQLRGRIPGAEVLEAVVGWLKEED